MGLEGVVGGQKLGEGGPSDPSLWKLVEIALIERGAVTTRTRGGWASKVAGELGAGFADEGHRVGTEEGEVEQETIGGLKTHRQRTSAQPATESMHWM